MALPFLSGEIPVSLPTGKKSLANIVSLPNSPPKCGDSFIDQPRHFLYIGLGQRGVLSI
ncbi:MAG: hypothetical protein H6Q41_2132 [Deltaproteobacteria bacterium]|nr:hypothetical protein [Deltaproteobacteria bacterium]